MDDPIATLPKRDRDVLRRIAEAANTTEAAAAAGILKSWLTLARDVPHALPRDPLSRRALSAIRRAGL